MESSRAGAGVPAVLSVLGPCAPRSCRVPPLTAGARKGLPIARGGRPRPHSLALRTLLVAAGAVFVTAVGATEAPVKVLEHHGKWESGYGAKFYNVVGRVKNTSSHGLRYVKLRVEAVDAQGKVVASTDTYNESAEVLTVPDAKPAELLKAGKVKPLDAGAEERFRASFLEEETPPFKDYRVRVVEAPAETK